MGTQQFPHPGVQRGFWWGYGAVSIFAPQPWDSPHPVVSSSPISPGFTHPAQLSTASSSRDDLWGLLGLGPYPRAGAMCVGLAAVFHNKSRWELNVPGSGPEASSAPCFSAALSLGLNLQSVITAPIRHWKPAILIMAFLIPPLAIFFPLASLGWFELIASPMALGGCRVARPGLAGYKSPEPDPEQDLGSQKCPSCPARSPCPTAAAASPSAPCWAWRRPGGLPARPRQAARARSSRAAPSAPGPSATTRWTWCPPTSTMPTARVWAKPGGGGPRWPTSAPSSR